MHLVETPTHASLSVLFMPALRLEAVRGKAGEDLILHLIISLTLTFTAGTTSLINPTDFTFGMECEENG